MPGWPICQHCLLNSSARPPTLPLLAGAGASDAHAAMGRFALGPLSLTWFIPLYLKGGFQRQL